MSIEQSIFAAAAQLALAIHPFEALQHGVAMERVAQEVQSLISGVEKGKLAGDAITNTSKRPIERLASLTRESRPEPTVVQVVTGDGRQQALLAQSGTQVMVYFRATTTRAERNSNRMFWLSSEHGAGVYTGMQETLDSTSPFPFAKEFTSLFHAKEPSFFDAVQTSLQSLVKKASGQPGHAPEVTIAGFSRGGTLAEIAAARWLQTTDLPIASVMTFMSPRAGDLAFTHTLDKLADQKHVTVTRAVMGGDPVSSMPPAFLGYSAGPGTLLYYPQELTKGVLVDPTKAAQDCDNLLVKHADLAGNRHGIDYHTSGQSTLDLEHRSLEIEWRLSNLLHLGKNPALRDIGIVKRGDQAIGDAIASQAVCTRAGLVEKNERELRQKPPASRRSPQSSTQG